MIDLDFQVLGAEAVRHAAAPLLALRLRIAARGEAPAIRGIALRCQIRIEPARRRYSAGEADGLFDLFGEPRRWNETLHAMLWTHASAMVPPFTGNVEVDMPVPCSSDFNLAAARFFGALEDGEAPLCLLFSGTVFHDGDDGSLRVAPISWDKEATYRLPVRTWKEMMDIYYPNTAWLCLRKDVFDRLRRHKARSGSATWEDALAGLLDAAERTVAP